MNGSLARAGRCPEWHAFGGNGIIADGITLSGGGILAPGESVGKITANGAVQFGSGWISQDWISIQQMEPPIRSARVGVSIGLGVTPQGNLIRARTADFFSQVYTIIDNRSANAVAGMFSNQPEGCRDRHRRRSVFDQLRRRRRQRRDAAHGDARSRLQPQRHRGRRRLHGLAQRAAARRPICTPTATATALLTRVTTRSGSRTSAAHNGSGSGAAAAVPEPSVVLSGLTGMLAMYLIGPLGEKKGSEPSDRTFYVGAIGAYVNYSFCQGYNPGRIKGQKTDVRVANDCCGPRRARPTGKQRSNRARKAEAAISFHP